MPSLIAHGLDWGPRFPPYYLVKTQIGKEAVTELVRTLPKSSIVGIVSPALSLLSFSVPQHALPSSPGLAKRRKKSKEKLPRASRDKDYFP